MKQIILILFVVLISLCQGYAEESNSQLIPTSAGTEASVLVSYRDSVRTQKVPCSPKVLSTLWNILKKETGTSSLPSDGFNINTSIESIYANRMEKIWRESPWSAKVCQADFQRWILPYRCADEMVDFEGDSLLKQMYAPLIEGVNNPKEAFRIISKRIYDTIRECNSDCPYILDAYTINYIRQANCEQRCVLLVHILRQLGIPCCIDRIPFWGNYSTVGHSWVAMVFEGKTYVYDDSSKDGSVREASSGPIDAALFP